jgi:hypothetical protein
MLDSGLQSDLRRIDPEREYYALTLSADASGRPCWAYQTAWVGWVDNVPGREIRQACLVIPDRIAECWRVMGEAHIVVNSIQALAVYFMVGGNALVDSDIARFQLPELLQPKPTAHDGLLGFKSVVDLPPNASARAVRPKTRMRILKRDSFRCRICGRRPDDYPDIELHVHHVRPWSKGGLTEDGNLITLCSTCHNGLDPHWDPTLFEILKPGSLRRDAKREAADYLERVQRYRIAARQMYEGHWAAEGNA